MQSALDEIVLGECVTYDHDTRDNVHDVCQRGSVYGVVNVQRRSGAWLMLRSSVTSATSGSSARAT